MVTVTEVGNTWDIRGLSSDDKPTVAYVHGTNKAVDLGNGSTFLEMDTGKVFIWDLDNKEWHEL